MTSAVATGSVPILTSAGTIPTIIKTETVVTAIAEKLNDGAYPSIVVTPSRRYHKSIDNLTPADVYFGRFHLQSAALLAPSAPKPLCGLSQV